MVEFNQAEWPHLFKKWMENSAPFFSISEFHKTEGQKKKKILKLQNEFSNLNEASLNQNIYFERSLFEFEVHHTVHNGTRGVI